MSPRPDPRPEFAHTPVSAIWVPRDRRQRTQVVTDQLRDSIAARGVLHPIIITQEPGTDGRLYKLIAGERRYTCCIELGRATIPTRLFESLDPIEAQIIELEENIKRQDLAWQDVVRATSRIHGLYVLRNPDQTVTETAESIGLQKGTLSLHMKVASALDDERIAACGTAREAWNILSRRDQRAAGEALQDLIDSPVTSGGNGGEGDRTITLTDPASGDQYLIGITNRATAPAGAPDPARTLLHESFLQWAPRYTGQKFNLVHCDFPYGVNLFAGLQGGGASADGQVYDDSRDVFFRLLECLLEHRNRFMSVSAHMMFWFSDKHRGPMLERFAALAPELVLWPYPLVWLKSDNAGVAQDVRRGPRHVYETCLLATRGDRNICQVVADAYSAPTDRRWHPSTKPEPMLRHFMRMLVDGQSLVLDPTCGSGSAIRAAESLGARHCLGMDSDEQTIGLARTALRQSRGLRQSGL